ncbi:MAG TPA: metallophosphoesterase family protein [Chloroflexota bacterium]|nr:metallophosphoesterase family protein [Chloroflexota bacterium]
MTIWAFVSDIHGNAKALRRADAWCADHRVERIACLGDVIGRGDPESCVEWVIDRADIAVVGNRDRDYLGRVRPELQAVVQSWPNEASAADFVVSHGDPRLHRTLNTRAIGDGFRRAVTAMEERGARLWFFGHTHHARVWRVDGAAVQQIAECRVELRLGALYVVNVGCVGLPLPGKGPPSIVRYDDVAGDVWLVGMGR